jgi:hypothetical protein
MKDKIHLARTQAVAGKQTFYPVLAADLEAYLQSVRAGGDASALVSRQEQDKFIGEAQAAPAARDWYDTKREQELAELCKPEFKAVPERAPRAAGPQAASPLAGITPAPGCYWKQGNVTRPRHFCGRSYYSPSSAYLQLAAGRAYIDMAFWQMKMLREVGGDHCDYVLMTPPADRDYAMAKGVFTKVLVYDLDKLDPQLQGLLGGVDKGDTIALFKAGPTLLALQSANLGLDEFIMLDVDVLPINNLVPAWQEYRKSKQDIVLMGKQDDCPWHWGHLCDIRDKINEPGMHKTHTGLNYFKNVLTGSAVKEYARHYRHAWLHFDELGFLRQFRGSGIPDEILASYAFAKMGYIPYETYGGGLGGGVEYSPPYTQEPFMLYSLAETQYRTELKDGLYRYNNLGTRQIVCQWVPDGVQFIHCFDKSCFESAISSCLQVPMEGLFEGWKPSGKLEQ